MKRQLDYVDAVMRVFPVPKLSPDKEAQLRAALLQRGVWIPDPMQYHHPDVKVNVLRAGACFRDAWIKENC